MYSTKFEVNYVLKIVSFLRPWEKLIGIYASVLFPLVTQVDSLFYLSLN